MKVQVQFSTLTLEGEDKIEAYPKIDQNPVTGLKESMDLENRECWNYSKPGHYMRSYTKPKKNMRLTLQMLELMRYKML